MNLCTRYFRTRQYGSRFALVYSSTGYWHLFSWLVYHSKCARGLLLNYASTRLARKQPRDAFEAWWSTAAPERYRPLKLKATIRCPKELVVPRPSLHYLLAARSHHGDFAVYHERSNHTNARLTCSCGRRKEPKHLF
jgi:hypothetical protein